MPGINDFLTLAERDRQVSMKMEEDFPQPWAVAAAEYHIQQSVEKQLEALILLYGENPEFTHNIVKLTSHCEKLVVTIPECLDDISDTLTLWETSSWYDPFISFTEKKYGKAVQAYDELSRMIGEKRRNSDTRKPARNGISSQYAIRAGVFIFLFSPLSP